MNSETATNNELINKNGMPVDFSELGEKGLFYRLTHFNLKDPLTLIVLAACFAPIVVIGVVYGDVLGEYLYLMALPMSLYLVLPVVMLASRGYHRELSSTLGWFAMANKWKKEKLVDPSIVIPPSISSQFKGSRHSTTEIIKVDLSEISFDLAYVNIRNQYDDVQKMLVVARYQLPGQSPLIVLDNREITSMFTGFDSGLVETVLEGNFRQNFRLLHRPGEHIDALSVITPDVMLVSQQSQTKFEIEVSGNYLYLFSKFDHTDEKGIRDLLSAMTKIAPEIIHQVKSSRLPRDLLEK